MKVTYRIPTNEPYAFVEIEDDAISDPGLVYSRYTAFSDVFKPKLGKPGLDDKTWQAWLIRQLLGEGNGVEDMEQMSDEQRKYSHDIKKALATIKRRQDSYEKGTN